MIHISHAGNPPLPERAATLPLGQPPVQDALLQQQQAMLNAFRSSLFQKFLEVTSDGFIAINTDGYIIEINQSFCKLLGVTYDEALTKHILELIPETKMLDTIRDNITEVDILDTHELGALKGVDLVCSRSTFEINQHCAGSFAIVRYPDTSAAVAKSFQRMSKELEYYKKEYKRYVRETYGFDRIIGSSPAIQTLKAKALRASELDLTVLLQGETGTGKEVFAHAIHNASARARKPFIRVNCAAIPVELIESELFGYEEGAFSGARKGGKPGKIEMADQGTLFLDEIGDMPLPMQAKLLRVLQNQELERLGGTTPKTLDVRVIAATNQNLEQRIKEKKFRADLYYRLNVITLTLTPLRQRSEDIAQFANHFLNELNAKHDAHKTFHSSALRTMQHYVWPGNVRELHNAVGYAFGFSESSMILHDSLPYAVSMRRTVPFVTNVENGGLAEMLRELENGILLDTLDKYGGNVELAAEALSIHKATFYKKLRRTAGHSADTALQKKGFRPLRP